MVVRMKSQFLNNYEKELVQDAEKKAIKNRDKAIARKMKQDKVPIEKIIAYTGLSLNTINSL